MTDLPGGLEIVGGLHASAMINEAARRLLDAEEPDMTRIAATPMEALEIGVSALEQAVASLARRAAEAADAAERRGDEIDAMLARIRAVMAGIPDI